MASLSINIIVTGNPDSGVGPNFAPAIDAIVETLSGFEASRIDSG